jgi:putative hemolysin
MNQRILWIISSIIVVVGIVLFFVGKAEAPTTPQQQAGIANPASVNCADKLRGTLEIVDEPDGQVGYCHLPDGRVCEEWSLFRGGCMARPPAGAETTAHALIGQWRSTDDTRYTLEIAQTGNAIERYENDASATATSSWQLFTAASPDTTFTGAMQKGTVYLTLTELSVGPRHFAVIDVSGTALTLLYLDRGGTLNFTKVQ